MIEPTTLEQIQTRKSAGQLGTLANTVLFLAHQDSRFSQYSDNPISDIEAVERLKRKKIYISFQTFDCHHQRALNRQVQGQIPIRPYGMNVRVADSQIHMQTSHFKWNGSWEGLDHELTREAIILQELGFEIEYKRYSP